MYTYVYIVIDGLWLAWLLSFPFDLKKPESYAADTLSSLKGNSYYYY